MNLLTSPCDASSGPVKKQAYYLKSVDASSTKSLLLCASAKLPPQLSDISRSYSEKPASTKKRFKRFYPAHRVQGDTMSDLQHLISESTKTAMKAREKERVAVLRMVNAEFKRVEVDERRELTDPDVIGILNKMLKQRQDSLQQFQAASREDLAQQEAFEIDVIQGFLPEQMSDEELETLINKVINQSGAQGMQDMGKVMGAVKSAAQGLADMGRASALVKSKLA